MSHEGEGRFVKGAVGLFRAFVLGTSGAFKKEPERSLSLSDLIRQGDLPVTSASGSVGHDGESLFQHTQSPHQRTVHGPTKSKLTLLQGGKK